MPIFPLIVLVLCIALAAFFEVAYNLITKRWRTPADRTIWTCILWLLVVVMTSVCQLIPHKPPESAGWGVIMVIAFLHILMAMMGNGFHSLPGPSRPNPPPGSGTSSAANIPQDRSIHKGQ
jgi:drug/metabolite transporter (DMT)-like permease